ncbi:MAG: hypothetical protein WC967_13450 [Balneolaceae bacterium]
MKPTKDKFKNKDGSLTLYALACGYLQQKKLQDDTIIVELSLDGCFHVKVFDDCGLLNRERLSWDCYDTLTEARKAYKQAIKVYKQAIKKLEHEIQTN